MSGKKYLIAAMVLGLTLAGFIAGSVVNAAVGTPGSQSDPLVTKSYVDNEAAKLQKQIDALKLEVEKLKNK